MACSCFYLLFISWFLHQTTTRPSRVCPDWPLFISWFLHQTTTCCPLYVLKVWLFISWFLHQTTTVLMFWFICAWLFISWFLHQTTTPKGYSYSPQALFISWFLHQTTTLDARIGLLVRCLSLDSYIKPQPFNKAKVGTTRCLSLDSYIKPQRGRRWGRTRRSCLSLDSYIKPQRACSPFLFVEVVYLLIPTSNHNPIGCSLVEGKLFISWFLHQTTTLSCSYSFSIMLFISWFLHQTTTGRCGRSSASGLFISWFLHQTTTSRGISREIRGCLSLDSYIKPQPFTSTGIQTYVVYLLIPTSNHNHELLYGTNYMLFISWFLHQTTTMGNVDTTDFRCLSLDSYIKPQPYLWNARGWLSCLSLDSYIKPQLRGQCSG